MCDTFAVTPGDSLNRKLWFAKNSDRSPNEPNLIISLPAKTYSPGENLKLTYISVPQSAATNALVMVKPSWTWGCEIGVNEHGVCIGNEAVFTKGAYPKTGLIGMDVCRLILERCSNAAEGLTMIGALIEQYGQGGNCGFDSEFYYDNSFLIADSAEAYVLESAGNLWIAKRVTGVYAISNMFTIDGEWDFCCAELESQQGSLNFAKKYTDGLRTSAAGGSLRRFSVYQALINARDGKPVKNLYSVLLGNMYSKREKATGIDYSACKAALRSHTENGGYTESPCMHYGGLVGSHTTGSMIMCPEERFIGVASGSTPCFGVYMPFSLRGRLPFEDDEQKAERRWLKRELIQRNLLAGHIDRDAYRLAAASLERDLDLISESFGSEDDSSLNAEIYKAENDFSEKYFEMCSRDASVLVPRGSIGYKKRWNKKNRALLERISELRI